MKALTVWQPWATLIIIGAKPFEFRKWDFRSRAPSLEGQRIAIHAGARPIKPKEIEDLILRCERDNASLISGVALPLLRRIAAAPKCQGVVPLSAVVGTAILQRPRKIRAAFQSPDSTRIEQHMWAWPLTDIEPSPPIPCRGAQGFWNYSQREAA